MPGSIFVVDDEANLRHTLAFILKRSGYFVTSAENAQEAIKQLNAGSFDLMILDLKIPDMEGLALLQLIRQDHPGLPVLILTAYGSMDSAIEALRLGARDYFLKPVDPAKLLIRIETILEEERNNRRYNVIIHKVQNLLNELGEISSPEPAAAAPHAAVQPAETARYLHRGPFFIDLKGHYLEIDDHPVSIPPSTFAYLVTLMRHSPDPVSYQELVAEAQGYTLPDTEARALARWQIYQMRQTIESDPDNPRYVLTVRNIGYRMIVESGHESAV